MKKLILFGFILLLTACGRISIYKYKAHNFDPADLNKPQVAILHVTQYNFVNEIDGTGKYSPSSVSDAFPYSGAEIELLPGQHTLAMSFRSKISHSTGKSNVVFNFLPGRQYFLHSNAKMVPNGAGGFVSVIAYQIDECGSAQETEYNIKAKKEAWWLAPYVPACGSEK